MIDWCKYKCLLLYFGEQQSSPITSKNIQPHRTYNPDTFCQVLFFECFLWSHQVTIGHWPPTVWWCFFGLVKASSLQDLLSSGILSLLWKTVYPSKHDTLTQCCFDVGPTSKQHWVTVSCLLGWVSNMYYPEFKKQYKTFYHDWIWYFQINIILVELKRVRF